MTHLISRPLTTRAAEGHSWRYAFLLITAGIVVTIDQAVKAVVAAQLGSGRVVVLLDGAVQLDYTRNTGAAFGMYQTGGAFFVTVALLVVISILAYYPRVVSRPFPVRLALGLVLGGALGNLVDRLRLGYVVDFIDLRWWPVFNLADSCIVVGVLLLALFSVFPPAARPHG